MNNKELALQWFDLVWNQKKAEAITELLDPSAEATTEAGVLKGPEEFRKLMFEPFIQALPDLKVDVTGCIAEGELVAVKLTARATHLGSMMHLPPSGRAVQFSGISWFVFAGGKIIGGSDSYNLHGLLHFLSTGEPSMSVLEG